jgi:hypothetical protein
MLVWREGIKVSYALKAKDYQNKNNTIYLVTFWPSSFFLGNFEELPNFLAKLKSSQSAKKPKVIP